MSLQLAIDLLEQEFISQDQFVTIVSEHESSRMPEITIALSRSMVTTLQAREIMDFQSEHPDKSFCDIARRLGYLSKSQCENISQLQDASRRPVDQILVDLEICTRSQASVIDRSLRVCRGNSDRQLPTPKFSRRVRNSKANSGS